MVKLPRIPGPRLAGWPEVPLLSSVRGRIITGFGLLVLILVVAVGGCAWLTREHRSDMAEMEHYMTIADLLQDAQIARSTSATFLYGYVTTGNEELLPSIRASLATSEGSIDEALAKEKARGGELVADLGEIKSTASALEAAALQMLALTRAGDAETALAMLDAATPVYNESVLEVASAVKYERQQASALKSRADRTGDLAFWLLVVSGGIGATLGLLASVFIARSILKPLSSLESAALAVADGNLEARAPATGLRELARLRDSVNRMTESLLDASRRRELEEERERAFAQVREGEARFRTLAETAAAAIFIYQGTRICYANAAAEAITAYTRQEWLAISFWDVIHPDFRDLVRERGIARQHGEQVPQRYEVKLLTKAGEERWVDFTAGAIQFEGKPAVLGTAFDITERKRAQEALRESEEKWRSLAENIPDIVMTLDRDGTILFINRVPPGSTVEGTVGAIVYDYVPPEHHDALRTRLERVFETGEVQDYEIAAPGPFGATSWYFNRIGPVMRDRSVVAATIIATDITERKRAEEAIREADEKYRTLVKQASDYIIILQHGKAVYLNPSYAQLLGYTAAETADRSFLDFVAPEDRARVQEYYQKRLQGEPVPEQYELGVLTKDGRRVTMEVKPRVIQYRGEPATMVIQRDITERKRAEEALRESEETARALLNAPTETAVLASTDGTILAANEAAAQVVGRRVEEIVGRRISDLFPPQVAEALMASHDAVARSGKAVRSDFEVLERWFDTVVYPVVDTHGKVARLAIFARDITERKQAEEELRRLNQELEALNRSLDAKVRERTRELRERNRQILDARAQAATDALTGLWNHRAFHERLREEIRRAQETSSPVGLIMMDIDDFKLVNDSLGHLWGDHILRGLASTVAKVMKREDAYRYGGDEFAVLLPGVDSDKAARVAERLRRALAKRTDGNSNRVTVSVGIASFPDTAASAEELIYGADAAMYWAKAAGKNRVGDWGKLLTHRTDGALPWYAAERGVKAPDVVAALVAALAAKDPVTAAHTERCSWYTARLAEELGLPGGDRSIVRLASLLHDIGKLAIPDEVLFKPGPLTEEEWAQMKQHPTAALHVLGQIRSLTDAIPAILHHHEHFDGSGYPDGLTGEEIPIASRILLVTDSFDAMTTDRPYRKAMPIRVAVEELKRNRDSQFDPTVVDAFLRMLAREGAQPLRQKAARHARPTAAATAGSHLAER